MEWDRPTRKLLLAVSCWFGQIVVNRDSLGGTYDVIKYLLYRGDNAVVELMYRVAGQIASGNKDAQVLVL